MTVVDVADVVVVVVVVVAVVVVAVMVVVVVFVVVFCGGCGGVLFGTKEVNRLRKVLDPPPPSQPLEPTNDQLAFELASKRQQQDKLKKQVVPLQQRVADAEVKLIKQKISFGTRSTQFRISTQRLGSFGLRSGTFTGPLRGFSCWMRKYVLQMGKLRAVMTSL